MPVFKIYDFDKMPALETDDNLAELKEAEATVSPLTPFYCLEYLTDRYFVKCEDGVDGEELVPVDIKLTIDESYLDYSLDDTRAELAASLFFRSLVDLILVSSSNFIEFVRDDSVDGIILSADSTGFMFKSKRFTSMSNEENSKELLSLVGYRYVSLKRQFYSWTNKSFNLNSVAVEDYNFFTHTQDPITVDTPNQQQ